MEKRKKLFLSSRKTSVTFGYKDFRGVRNVYSRGFIILFIVTPCVYSSNKGFYYYKSSIHVTEYGNKDWLATMAEKSWRRG